MEKEKQDDSIKELMRLSELDHKKSEIINKNAETISELCNKIHVIDCNTINFQQKVIYCLFMLHLINFLTLIIDKSFV